jgi:hypothetical protein
MDWNDYQYCDEFSFLEAAFLWLEIEPNDKQKKEPPIHVKGLNDKIKKFVISKRWEKLLSQKEDAEGFIFKQVLEKRKDKIFSSFSELENLFGPKEDRDDRSQEERWVIEKEKPCSEVEREEVFARMPPGEFYDSVTREELLCFADLLGEKPKFLFPEMMTNIAKITTSDSEDKPLPTKKRNSYLKLIKGLLQKQGIDPSERGIAKILVGIVKDAKQSLESDAIRGILKEIQDLEEDD